MEMQTDYNTAELDLPDYDGLSDFQESEEKAEGNLVEILKSLKDQKQAIDAAEADLKLLKKAYETAERLACRLMRQDDIDKIRIRGYEFSPALPAYKIIGSEAEAFAWLEQQGYGNAIKQSKPTINHNTLSKLMRERVEESGIGSLPPGLIGWANINRLTIKEK